MSRKRITYPRYRVSQWFDSSEEAFQKNELRVVYGIQVQLGPREKWGHCAQDGKPLYFSTAEEASAAISKLGDAKWEPTNWRQSIRQGAMEVRK